MQVETARHNRKRVNQGNRNLPIRSGPSVINFWKLLTPAVSADLVYQFYRKLLPSETTPSHPLQLLLQLRVLPTPTSTTSHSQAGKESRLAVQIGNNCELRRARPPPTENSLVVFDISFHYFRTH